MWVQHGAPSYIFKLCNHSISSHSNRFPCQMRSVAMPPPFTTHTNWAKSKKCIHTSHGSNISTPCYHLTWKSMKTKWSSWVCRHSSPNWANYWNKHQRKSLPIIWCGVSRHSHHSSWPKNCVSDNWPTAPLYRASKNRSHAGRNASTSPVAGNLNWFSIFHILIWTKNEN